MNDSKQLNFIKTLQKVIYDKFNLDLIIDSFGDNKTRNNVFVGKNIHENEFIIKIYPLNQLNHVQNSIKISEKLLESNILSSSNYLISLANKPLYIFENEIITIQIKESLIKINSKSENDIHYLEKLFQNFIIYHQL